MIVDYGNYTYYDDKSKDKKRYNKTNAPQGTAFDVNSFNNLIADRRYDEACEMASKYHFKDPQEEKDFQNEIINLRRAGRRLGAIYSRIPGDDTDRKSDKRKVEFLDNVFGDLNNIKGNDYKDDFNLAKRMLGSYLFIPKYRRKNSKENFKTTNFGTNIAEEATALDVTFEPKKQYGIFGWDWIKKDNENNIDNFYKKSGLTKNILTHAGIDVIEKDGKTTLHFDKNNPLANKIIYNIPHAGMKIPKITGYNANGEAMTANNYKNVYIPTYEKSGSNEILWKIHNLVDDCNVTKNKYFGEKSLMPKVYSSMKGGMLFDDFQALQQEYKNGGMTSAEYNRAMNVKYKNIMSQLKSINLADKEIYSNLKNGADVDDEQETLHPNESPAERNTLINLISATDMKDINLQSMISNGRIGTLITINAREQQERANNQRSNVENPEENIFSKRYQIFIPGLFHDEAQRKINEDATTRSAQELNDMQDWDYEYKTSSGKVIAPSGTGTFYIDKNEVDKNTALREITKDMTIEDARAAFKYKYLNHNGGLINEEDYDNTAKIMAYHACDEMYPNLPIVDSKGKLISLEELFSHRNPEGLFADSFGEEIPYELYYKILDIYDIYGTLMDDIEMYK